MRNPRIEVTRSAHDRQWRWAFMSNGRCLSDSGQGYTRRIDCLAGALATTGCEPVRWLSDKPVLYGQTRRILRDHPGRYQFIEIRVWP
ncbi:hypothetical protein [Luteipulveratus mongoliensis]|uniref:DUF1508 domain-containing protein n=1 Tax=Luteipulveratus mongoliensis TaxID=571913 RepID=A0A0K1JGR4_9MICO|nr:hypothetical protein [Luteipulveratus mongoliensis]AKU15775.1 hypothetical protein VV02_07770 [Luteipulveratus mongoliensis]